MSGPKLPSSGSYYRDPATTDSSESDEKPIRFRDIAPAMEFAFRVVVALASFLRRVNGAAVTDDQFVIQIGCPPWHSSGH
jgi:hypothetical protein